LGWAGEAGPDPSVFSIWDGKTIRQDLGGLEALLRLRKKADELDMKILLCVVSHFSRANVSYSYQMPASELAEMGFGLRIDVGHGFDTVFPIDDQLRRTAQLTGEVTVEGFDPIDLRGTDEPNIPLLYMCYKIQKSVPKAIVVYSEQWHGISE
jgi:hypothetical protein